MANDHFKMAEVVKRPGTFPHFGKDLPYDA